MPFEPGNKFGIRDNNLTRALITALNREADYVADGHTERKRRLWIVADQLVKAACAGEPWAIREVWDRVEGKAKQQVNATLTANVPQAIDKQELSKALELVLTEAKVIEGEVVEPTPASTETP